MTRTCMLIFALAVSAATLAQAQDAEIPRRPTDPAARAQFDSVCAIGELATSGIPPSRTTDPDGYAQWRDDPKKVWLKRAIASSAAVGREEAWTVSYLVNAAMELGSREGFFLGPYLTITRACEQALSAEANP